MVIGIKDSAKLVGVSVIACCAIFVCTMFLCYNDDLAAMKDSIPTEAIAVYNAQISTGKVTVAVTGGCLALTSFIMLMFYIKNYIDVHGKELGILKALGYSAIKVAKHFYIFGLSVFVGCGVGFSAASVYLPTFYKLQNAEKLFPDITPAFHPGIFVCLVVLPTAFFSVAAVLYACHRLKKPVLKLIKEMTEARSFVHISKRVYRSFLAELRHSVLTSKRSLSFFVAFSAFCFAAMVQMSVSMRKVSGATFAWMIIIIGLILAFVTLVMSLSNVVSENMKTLAMLKAFGYDKRECGMAVLGGYIPMALIGFAVGTVYQYVLLKIMINIVFADVGAVPEYNFDVGVLMFTVIAFVAAYGAVVYSYYLRLEKTSMKSIMTD